MYLMKQLQLGSQGREHVRKHFLLPELVRRYLHLLQFYSGTNHELPEFRLNDLTYSETMNVVRSKHLLNNTVYKKRQCSQHLCSQNCAGDTQ